MNTLTHAASFHILIDTPDVQILDRLIILFKHIIAIIMFFIIVWQDVKPVIWFVIDFIQAIVFVVRVVEVVIKSILFAL